MIEIKHRWSGAIIHVVEGETLVGASLSGANLSDANLSGANLSGANLFGADLSGADLSGANLRRAYLSGAYLRRADLRRAYLFGAYLFGADLSGARLNWNSHELIAEVLRQAAGDALEHRAVGGLVLVSRDWCWSDFAERFTDQQKTWALSVLREHVQEGDVLPREMDLDRYKHKTVVAEFGDYRLIDSVKSVVYLAVKALCFGEIVARLCQREHVQEGDVLPKEMELE